MMAPGLTRRSLLKMAGGLALGASAMWAGIPTRTEDDAFLDDLSKRSFRYFADWTDHRTGVTADHARCDGSAYDTNRRDVGSIAATGFGLTAFCIGAERGWMAREEARARVRNTLQFFANDAPQEHGWFYHWMNVKNGRRCGACVDSRNMSELSSIDTALLMAGVLTARGYFSEDAEIDSLAAQLYQSMDFHWMLNGDPMLLSHGWTPERGFLPWRWDQYNELTILNLMGIGSPTYAMKPESWYAWGRPENAYEGYKYIGFTPLFTYQYSHAFVDYRGRPEKFGTKVDWFENSVTATRANRQFCIDLAKEFPGYSGDVWGITCSESATGYRSWGGPPRIKGLIEGTVVPCAAGGSLMLAPEICLPALRAMQERYGEKIYGRYGFADAFQPGSGWVSPDVLGIDVGITLVSAENLRSGNVWKWFMRNGEIRRAMELAGMPRS
jgi:hypothetical protein